MIQNAQVTPILPVVDLSRATGFYRDRLGLKDLGDEAGNHLLATGAGATIGLMEADVCVMDDEKAAWFADSEGNILCLHERAIGDMGR